MYWFSLVRQVINGVLANSCGNYLCHQLRYLSRDGARWVYIRYCHHWLECVVGRGGYVWVRYIRCVISRTCVWRTSARSWPHVCIHVEWDTKKFAHAFTPICTKCHRGDSTTSSMLEHRLHQPLYKWICWQKWKKISVNCPNDGELPLKYDLPTDMQNLCSSLLSHGNWSCFARATAKSLMKDGKRTSVPSVGESPNRTDGRYEGIIWEWSKFSGRFWGLSTD